MTDLLDRLAALDPVSTGITEQDATRLRAAVADRIEGGGVRLRPAPQRPGGRRLTLVGVGVFALVIVIFIPVYLAQRPKPIVDAATEDTLRDLPGVQDVIRVGSAGGVRTSAIDGDTMWVVSSNDHELYRVDLPSGTVQETYPLEGYIEGVSVSGGYVWLNSYENGGEVLRFDPETGLTDLISVPEPVTSGIRVGDELWRTTENGGLLVIDDSGVVTEQQLPSGLEGGALIGYVDGYVWMVVEGGVAKVNPDGLGFEVMPYEGAVPFYRPFLSSPRWVIDVNGVPWVLDTERNAVVRIDEFSSDGEAVSSVPVGRFPHSGVYADGYLWVTSYDDYTLSKVNPETMEVESVTPFPGRPSGLEYAEGSLWVFLYQSGFLVRLDPGAELQNLDVTFDEVVNIDDRQLRLRCSGAGDPLVILDADVDLGAGSWSVVQAGLSADHEVCSFDRSGTYSAQAVAPAGSAEQQVSDLMTALGEMGLADRRFIFVAHGEAVADTQAFALAFGEQLDGVVLVDPTPADFAKYPDDSGDRFPYEGSGDFGDTPLVVIGHDMDVTFRSSQFIAGQGAKRAEEVSTKWQEGLAGYAALSTNSTQLLAEGSNHSIPWERPQMIVDAVNGLFGP
ncbi:MAG: hypothetical protein WD473_08440 [Acidimicrobiia bacterium]